jgi:hypothetical protein
MSLVLNETTALMLLRLAMAMVLPAELVAN